MLPVQTNSTLNGPAEAPLRSGGIVEGLLEHPFQLLGGDGALAQQPRALPGGGDHSGRGAVPQQRRLAGGVDGPGRGPVGGRAGVEEHPDVVAELLHHGRDLARGRLAGAVGAGGGQRAGALAEGARAKACLVIRPAPAPRDSPRPQPIPGASRRTRVSGPGHQAAISAWAWSVTSSTRPMAWRQVWTSTGRGRAGARCLALNRASTADGLKGSQPTPYRVSVGSTTSPPRAMISPPTSSSPGHCSSSLDTGMTRGGAPSLDAW